MLSRSQPVFNWIVSDYQQMRRLQRSLTGKFEQFLVAIAEHLHALNIYCCHRGDFDADNTCQLDVSPASLMTSMWRRLQLGAAKGQYKSIGAYYAAQDVTSAAQTLFSSVKRASRSFFKVFFDFDGIVSHLTDFLRASFVFDNFEDLYAALLAIHHFTMDDGGILKFKNSFLLDAALNNGWRQIILNVALPGSEVVVEIQLHFCLFWQLKDATHRMSQISRVFKIHDRNKKTNNLIMECAKQFYADRPADKAAK